MSSPYAFSFEPLFLALAAVALVLYWRAARAEPAPRFRIVLFALGLALIAGALNSPLETLAADYLLLVHLLQNVMIADWAPPLLILGLTPAMRAALARRGGRPLALLTRPKVALPVWLVGWYGIHLALFYDFALENQWALNLEHALLIAIGLVFWWPVFSAEPHRLSTPVTIGYLGAGFVGSMFLGLALTFSQTPVYDYYTEVPRIWGLTAVEDQNFGGILMSTEQAIVFLAAITYFLVRLLREEEAANPPSWGGHPGNPEA
ncbi:MAG TPA: cytochrome c oxidase assembly protein [Gaiellaceae bacterium]|nr:cytochrome c oxidase assembly protein [Gaiellaceae bacterium]